jgi:hypothetical protein
MPEAKDPVRDAFTRCARILERLPDDAARQRVVRAFVELLGMSAPKKES